jgi:hypothetical protein
LRTIKTDCDCDPDTDPDGFSVPLHFRNSQMSTYS